MLLDTSGIYALLDASEVRHGEAVKQFARARAPITHSYVLAELVALAHARRLPRSEVLDFISTLIESGEVEIVWAGRELHLAGHELLLARSDKAYSLCDAVSFVVMQARNEREALTTDRHFDQEGFVRLLD